jgi:hypothetical protein
MGNVNCGENICSDDLYELSWINTNNWDIKYENKQIENPYILNKGDFKLINNGYCYLSLTKKIDFEYEIKKILISIEFNFNLENDNEIELNVVLSNKLFELNNNNVEKDIINTIIFSKNNIIINDKNINLHNFRYELFLNFSYLNYIFFNEKVKKKDNIILDNNKTIDYDDKLDNIYFTILIKSNLINNENMDNYLNIKII